MACSKNVDGSLLEEKNLVIPYALPYVILGTIISHSC